MTPNTPGGPHTGPNDLQNFPVLTSVATTATDTVVNGTLNATPDTAFTVQFFSNDVADPSGHGQGKTFLGELTNVATDTDGVRELHGDAPHRSQPGQFVTATATDPAATRLSSPWTSAAPAATTTTLTALPTVAIWPARYFHGDRRFVGTSPGDRRCHLPSTGRRAAPAALMVVNGQDVATLALDALATGDHVVTAAYGGDSSFDASTSSPVDVTIHTVAFKPTVTTLTPSPTIADLGRLVTFTASVGEEDSMPGR